MLPTMAICERIPGFPHDTKVLPVPDHIIASWPVFLGRCDDDRIAKSSCPLGSCRYSRVKVRFVIGPLDGSVEDYFWHDIVWANGGPPVCLA